LYGGRQQTAATNGQQGELAYSITAATSCKQAATRRQLRSRTPFPPLSADVKGYALGRQVMPFVGKWAAQPPL